MPVKRRKPKEREHRITPEAVAAFRAGDVGALMLALGMRPWDASPLEADDEEPPAWSTPGPWRDSWPKAVALRRNLIPES